MQALQWIFSTPGASRCLMEGNIPYARASMDRFLHLPEGHAGLSYSSAEATSIMASSARSRAAQALLEDTSDLSMLRSCHVFGVACSAALVSAQPKKGAHRCHVAVASEGETCVYSLTLEKGLRTREAEDALCSRLIIDAIGHATTEGRSPDGSAGETSSGDFPFAKEVMSASEHIECSIRHLLASHINDVLERICCRQSRHALFVAAKQSPSSSSALPPPATQQLAYLEDVQLPRNALVFPGSFNPLHSGHVELVVAALKLRGPAPEGVPHFPVVFEIAAVNVDKPPVPKEELLSRIESLLSSPLLKMAGVTNVGVSITSEPLFVHKSRLFRGCTFVIGADTMSRLINSKYYRAPAGASPSLSEEQHSALASHAMVAALATIAERGCRFIVGGRVPPSSGPAEGKSSVPQFETLENITRSSAATLPPEILSMFSGIDETQFRADISSSEIRSRKEGKV